MNTVVDFEAKKKEREENTPHLQGTARCLACKHEWEAVAPVGVCVKQCPACECMQGRWRCNIAPPTGSLIWRCACGNDLMFVSPAGINCAACYKRAEFPA